LCVGLTPLIFATHLAPTINLHAFSTFIIFGEQYTIGSSSVTYIFFPI
jgi:hypothetical protein